MSARQVISVILGQTDKASPCLPGEVSYKFEALDSDEKLGFGLGQVLEELSEMGISPSETAVDLGMVALALTAADTRISRTVHAQDRWTRELALDIPVSNPTLWLSVEPLLAKMLNFLTGDRWQFRFRARPIGHDLLAPPASGLALGPKLEVCLFSGGLDSFIGAIDLCDQKKSPLLVSHYWDGETSKSQSLCIEALEENFPDLPISHLRARVGFAHDVLGTGSSENTLRGRSFLFFSLAVLAADALGGDQLVHVPENGLISLNVPLDPLRIGALSTRTTHPYYMARFNDFLAGLGLSIKLANPYAFKTKGEMVRGCRDQKFIAKAAANSMSCSSPAKARWHGEAPKHCGYCVPCLIRRASLKVGLGSDDTDYLIPDLTARELNSAKAEGMHVRSFQLALFKLRQNPGKARLDIHLPGPLMDHKDHLADYERVYTMGMNEVRDLLQGVRTKPR
jgi:7-cyano-7-deazaguanine synthase in queuosine biosynthesis